MDEAATARRDPGGRALLWPTSSRLFQLLPLVEDWISDRKRRLFAVACCRRFLPLLRDERSRRAVEVAERYADGLASEEERQAAEDDAVDVHIALRESRSNLAAPVCWTRQEELLTQATILALAIGIYYAEDAADYGRLALALNGPGWSSMPIVETGQNDAEQLEEVAQCALLRDIVGPLSFRPVTLAPAWLAANDAAAVQLAQGIYQARTFADLPILGDALEEAGCMDEDVLAHCRQGGDHVRGCWVVDLCLGKS